MQKSFREWQKSFINGEYNNPDRKTQIAAGWYDWFCKDSSLAKKTAKMGNIVKKIKEGGKIDFDNMYIFFKNNCPLTAPLYDDFRFCDIKTGLVIFTTQIEDKRAGHHFEIWSKYNDFKEPYFECDTQKELLQFFNQK